MPQNKLLKELRRDATLIFQSGVKAADPYYAVKRCLHSDGQQLQIELNLEGNGPKHCEPWSKIHLIAFGKAACTMIMAAQEVIPAHLLAESGIAVCNYENVAVVEQVDVHGAGHPLPDFSGFTGAQRIVEKALQAQAGELVLVLVSGGGSALIPCPVEGISLEDKIVTSDLLLASGANINDINCVRKHLSLLKGGGLAKLAAPAAIHALILSDVLGDELSAIASGPTVADETTFTEAIKVLNDKSLWHKVPHAVQKHLEKGAEGLVSETPKTNDAVFKHSTYTVIGSNAVSVHAVTHEAETQSYQVYIYSERLTGEAKDAAEELLLFAQNIVKQGINKPCAILAGGETTVTLQGSGLGGRNQEMALAFALAEQHSRISAAWVFLSAGTDGRDGPTDAAGGLVDNHTIERMCTAHIEPEHYLVNNDSYHALQISKDLLITGATGTNVADLQILLIQPNFKISHSGDPNV